MDSKNSKNPESSTVSDSSVLTIASLGSGLLWIVIGYIIIYYFHDHSFYEILSEGTSATLQMLAGVLTGLLFGGVGVWMYRDSAFKETLDDYFIVKQLKEFSLSNLQILQISIIAGISEEILFRAALQPVIGIWLTSALFIGVHGYIRFKTFEHSVFTLFTFLLSVVLGLLFIHFGLMSAILAHIIYDIVLLRELKSPR